MPGGDGTGPGGMGPMTGRAAGYCAGYPVPGYMNPGPGGGFGFGRGRGGGWGRRNQFYATGLTGWQRGAMGYPAGGVPPAYVGGVPPAYGPQAAEAETQFLTQQVEALQQQLEYAKKRLDELAAQEQKQDK